MDPESRTFHDAHGAKQKVRYEMSACARACQRAVYCELRGWGGGEVICTCVRVSRMELWRNSPPTYRSLSLRARTDLAALFPFEFAERRENFVQLRWSWVSFSSTCFLLKLSSVRIGERLVWIYIPVCESFGSFRGKVIGKLMNTYKLCS